MVSCPVPHLVAQNVNSKDLTLLVSQITEYGGMKSGPVSLALPFLFYNLAGADREAFIMVFPWIVTQVLVPIIWRGNWQPMSAFLLE
jgi:hypothetical protein